MSKTGPTFDWHAHHRAQVLEDAHFLLDSGCSMEETARRLGLTVYALEKALDRGTNAKSNAHSTGLARGGEGS